MCVPGSFCTNCSTRTISFFVVSVLSFEDWLTISGLELEAAVGHEVLKDSLETGVGGV